MRLSQSVLSHWSDWLVGFAAALAVAIPPTAETCIPPDAASDCVTGYLPGTPESPSQTCPPGCILTHATPPSASLFVLDSIDVNPLLVLPEGEGAVALDGLIATKD